MIKLSYSWLIKLLESVKTHLAKAGLCEQLNTSAQKHKDLLHDDEARGLLKMACDLMVSVLTGDEAMELLYLDGEGQVFKDMTDWLSADDEDLQVTAVLAMGNFARTGNKIFYDSPCSLKHK
jgi:hypothetical protein